MFGLMRVSTYIREKEEKEKQAQKDNEAGLIFLARIYRARKNLYKLDTWDNELKKKILKDLGGEDPVTATEIVVMNEYMGKLDD